MIKKNILLIGEFGLDLFLTVDKLRLSPEAASLVGVKSSISENWGMAGNVYNNLFSLSDKQNYELNVTFIKNPTPIIKTRFVDSKTKHIIFRLDEHDFIKKEEQINESKLIELLNTNNLKFNEYDAIVISSYNKGLVDKNFLNWLFNVAKQHNIPTFADFKFILGEWSRELFCAKINSVEMEDQKKNLTNPANYCKNLVVTHGSSPAEWFFNGKVENIPVLQPKNVFSTCGAGDTVLSQLVIKYLETNDLKLSIESALLAGSIKVTKNEMIVNREELNF